MTPRGVHWPFDRSYRALGYPFRVRTNVPEVGLSLDLLFAPFRSRLAPGAATYDLVHRRDAEVAFAVYLDGARVSQGHTFEAPADFVQWHVSSEAVRRTEDFLVLHAAAAARDGAAVVLPAPPDSGKTTLVAGLVHAGFDYLSDEAALIHTRTGDVHPFPRALWMGPASLDAIEGLAGALLPSFRGHGGRQYHVPAEAIRAGSRAEPSPARLIVAPSYEAGARTTLVPMRQAEAVALLAEQCFNMRRFGAAGLRLLRDVVAGARCYRLRTGALEPAVEAIEELAAPVTAG